MAGISLGASTPDRFTNTRKRPALRLAASSRTRRNHGAFLIGNELGTVCSSRRKGVEQCVLLQIGDSSLTFSGSMRPEQARAMARALIAAADASEVIAVPIVEEVSLPVDDEAEGVAWWNGLTDRGRGLWLEAAGTATPVDAWSYFKTIRNKFGLDTGSAA